MSTSGGRILVESAYAQSKMVDSSKWDLPRGITPSDVDLVFDNRGALLFGEFSRWKRSWEELEPGQRWLYESLAYRPGAISALLKHSVPVDTAICSRNDVEEFTLRYYDKDRTLFTRGPFPGELWPQFVHNWYIDRKSAVLQLPASVRG